LLSAWLEQLGNDLEAVSLDYVLEHHGPLGGEMVPTSSGEIEAEREALEVPGIARRDGRWVHEGGFGGAGGRQGHHSDDFEPCRCGSCTHPRGPATGSRPTAVRRCAATGSLLPAATAARSSRWRRSIVRNGSPPVRTAAARTPSSRARSVRPCAGPRTTAGPV